MIANRRIYEGDRLLDEAMAASPGSTLVDEALGRRALRANDLSGAARYYRMAMATGSVAPNAWLTSALDYREQSQGFGRDIAGGGRKALPPRLPEQPIFYPVTNEDYAIQIARHWNVKADGSGFVTRFKVDADYAATFPKKMSAARFTKSFGCQPKNYLNSIRRLLVKLKSFINSRKR